MLDDDHGIASRAQLAQHLEQHLVVARVQTDRRLVEDVADTLQVGTELSRQPDALCLSARQRVGSTVEREIAETDLLEKAQSRLDLLQHVGGYQAIAIAEAVRGDDGACRGDGRSRDLGDRLAAHSHGARLRLQPLAGARGTGTLAEER